MEFGTKKRSPALRIISVLTYNLQHFDSYTSARAYRFVLYTKQPHKTKLSFFSLNFLLTRILIIAIMDRMDCDMNNLPMGCKTPGKVKTRKGRRSPFQMSIPWIELPVLITNEIASQLDTIWAQ